MDSVGDERSLRPADKRIAIVNGIYAEEERQMDQGIQEESNL